ncbi:MAG TPA: carboxypeptidase-like regulatory domain-containing protein, partial [Bacteroidia bacterium]
MKNKILVSAYLICALQFVISSCTYAQNLTQTIRGKIIDKDAKAELPGVAVLLFNDSEKVAGAIADANGIFRMENIPVGRYSLKASYLGYQPYSIPDLIVTSAK